MLHRLRLYGKKNNNILVKRFNNFTTNISNPNKIPNPNPNNDFKPFILVCLLYMGADITQKFIEYKKNITKK